MKEALALSLPWPLPLRRLLLEGRRALLQGRVAEAERAFQDALQQEPNIPEAHVGLALARRPGPDYRRWLARLQAALRPAVYVEIGVETGLSLRFAGPETLAIGIDPLPQVPPAQAARPGLHLFAMTSQDFFAAADGLAPPLAEALRAVDFAFIDGDHRFATVLQDFIALEARMAPGGVIALHDTWPLNAHTASPVRRTGFYTGDGWKLVPCLRALRPDLRVMTVAAAPSGLTLVTGLDPTSAVLRQRQQSILETYARLPYGAAVERELALVPNTDAALDQLLAWRTPLSPSPLEARSS